MTGQRPDFFNAWRVFSQVNVNVALIGKIFGNKVKENIEISKTEDGKWTNACPIRMSYVLNRTGFPIQPDNKYGTVTARDGKWYMYRVSDMLLHLKDVFGSPDIEVNRVPVHDDFKDMKGILVVTGDGPNAKGHITLWNGLTCADICHFAGDDNGAFSPRKAALWILP
ncbi:MAG: type VI secretion system amidase effector protein Tae4 [Proteobacteria bacterium]|nr:type VI secretion system amidase effector protein Tae4 [Pseudomonadota bacterium]